MVIVHEVRSAGGCEVARRCDRLRAAADTERGPTAKRLLLVWLSYEYGAGCVFGRTFLTFVVPRTRPVRIVYCAQHLHRTSSLRRAAMNRQRARRAPPGRH